MTHKFVAVLNPKYPVPRLLNALGHVTAGLGARNERAPMGFVDYRDSAGGTYPNISAFPFIVLEGSSNHLRKFRQALLDAKLEHTCFLDTMLEGGSDAQVAKTAQTPPAQLDFVAICAFALREALDPLTKKFSLWK